QIDLSGVIAAKESQVEQLEQQVSAPDGDDEERREAARQLAAAAEALGRVRAQRESFLAELMDMRRRGTWVSPVTQLRLDDEPPDATPAGKPS
ncbi:hypothetical protein, partial [Planotetraspora kaengkrachanensis]